MAAPGKTTRYGVTFQHWRDIVPRVKRVRPLAPKHNRKAIDYLGGRLGMPKLGWCGREKPVT